MPDSEPSVRSGRDAYRVFEEFIENGLNAGFPPLVDFLCAFEGALESVSEETSFTFESFFDLLTGAIESASGHADQNREPGRFDDPDGVRPQLPWRREIQGQIEDLRVMSANGQLANEYRWLGLESPSGNTWYNFAVPEYLECASGRGFEVWYPEGRWGKKVWMGEVPEGKVGQPDCQVDALNWDFVELFLYCGRATE